MPGPLPQYETPAGWDDFPLEPEKRRRLRTLWHERVRQLTMPNAFGNYYDPLTTDLGDAAPQRVEWTAFPKPLVDDRNAFERADNRLEQGEYCEWCVERRDGKIVRVAFTSEVPEYWETLWEIDPLRVLALYRHWIHPAVQLEDLRDGDGRYVRDNRWNTGGEYREDGGGLMHLVVNINTLDAAIGVVAGAANTPGDQPVGFRGSFHADPLISLATRRVVQRLGARVSLSNPVGIYLQEPQLQRFALPPEAPRSLGVGDCWRVVRGDRATGRALHAVFEVPEGHGFVVGDLEVDGEPIRHGSQIARAVKSGTYVTPVPRT